MDNYVLSDENVLWKILLVIIKFNFFIIFSIVDILFIYRYFVYFYIIFFCKRSKFFVKICFKIYLMIFKYNVEVWLLCVNLWDVLWVM